MSRNKLWTLSSSHPFPSFFHDTDYSRSSSSTRWSTSSISHSSSLISASATFDTVSDSLLAGVSSDISRFSSVVLSLRPFSSSRVSCSKDVPSRCRCYSNSASSYPYCLRPSVLSAILSKTEETSRHVLLMCPFFQNYLFSKMDE